MHSVSIIIQSALYTRVYGVVEKSTQKLLSVICVIIVMYLYYVAMIIKESV